MKREYVELDIDAIRTKSDIPRRDTGDVSSLAASIAKLGILVPVIVDPQNVLISGARRLAACRQAGVPRVPAYRVDVPHNSMAALDIQVDLSLCCHPLSEEDVNELIGRKKAIANPDGGRGFFSRIRQWFRKSA